MYSTKIRSLISRQTSFSLRTAHLSFINSVDSDLVQTSSSLPQAHDTRSFRWDPNSGQFSYSQGHHELLQSGVALLQQMSASQPETIAVIQRQYHEKNCVEVGCTYEQLWKRVHSICDLLHHTPHPKESSDNICIVYLPISMLTVSVILALTLSNIRYCLIFTGFSSQAMYQLLSTGKVESTITSHHFCQELQKNFHDANIPFSTTVNLDPLNNRVKRDLEKYDVDPMFAIYTGGPSSLIAGTREITGYYQVSSNVTPGEENYVDDGLEVVEDSGEAERKFKLQKTKNSFRLDHIRDILDR